MPRKQPEPPPARKFAWPYVRASTWKQIESIEIQKETCAHYFEWRLQHKGFVLQEPTEDPAVSGSKQFHCRPAAGRLANMLEPGDAIIFSKLDRGFRNAADALQCINTWTAKGIEVHLLDVNMDTTTPIGRLLIGVIAVFAEWERSRIKERCIEGMARSRAAGNWHGGCPKYGWKYRVSQGRKILVPDTRIRVIGRHVIRCIEKGYTYDEIYWGLIRDKIYRPNGNEYSRTSLVHYLERERRLQAEEAAAQEAKENKNGSQAKRGQHDHLPGTNGDQTDRAAGAKDQ